MRAPAFQFYPKDWLADVKVQRLDLTARGAYFDTLCHMWNDSEDQCSIIRDTKLLARLWGVSPRRAEGILGQLQDPVGPVFLEEVRDGRTYLMSKRLRDERQAQDRRRQSRSENGRKGAQVKWRGHSEAIARPMANDSTASASATAIASAEREKAPPPLSNTLECFEIADRLRVDVGLGKQTPLEAVLSAWDLAYGAAFSPADLGAFWAVVGEGCLRGCRHSADQRSWCGIHIAEKVAQKHSESWKQSSLLRKCLREDRRDVG